MKIYPHSIFGTFMLFKKAVYNGLSLELYTPFEFQLRTELVPICFSSPNVSSVGWSTNMFWDPSLLVKYILPKKKW